MNYFKKNIVNLQWHNSIWASLVAQKLKNLPIIQEAWVQSLGQEDPLEKGMSITPVFLPEEFHVERR